jgi:putative membrane protein, TIGR04086 family/integral membrane protein, TIGR04097 family
MLGILTVIIWKMDGGSNVLSVGVIVIYILSNALGGFLVGKMMGQQKFFWGVVIGAAYFLVLFLIGVGLMQTKINGNMQIISGAMVCVISGMLGGMVAPGGKNV